ncbi:MAG: FGGY-family carbohydrate kinase, partial [Actinomycetota bacterium]
AEAFTRSVEGPLSTEDFLALVGGGITIGRNVAPGRFALLGGMWSGLAMRRFLALLGIEGETAEEELDAAAVALSPGADGVRVEDPFDEPAAIVGIPRHVSPAHVWRATLEALQRRGLAIVETMDSVVGARTRLVVTGGGVRGDAVRAIKRAVLGPFEEPAVEEAGARGAALIGGVAAGLYDGIDDVPAPGSG